MLEGLLAYFPRALEQVANVSKYGAEKYEVPYSDKNWERVSNGIDRYGSALVRHLIAEQIDGWYDRESGLLHAAHAAWDAIARLELILRKPEASQNYECAECGEEVPVAAGCSCDERKE